MSVCLDAGNMKIMNENLSNVLNAIQKFLRCWEKGRRWPQLIFLPFDKMRSTFLQPLSQ